MLNVQQFRPAGLWVCVIFLLSGLFTRALAHPAAGSGDYAKATRLLTQGKNFEQAITLLQASVKAQPKNPDYHLALGCAYADRAVSIAYARAWQRQYERDKADYSKNLADWRADQKKEPSPWPAPTKPPSTFRAYTKDDGKPLTLSNDQALAQVTALSKAAQAEWQAGVALAGKGEERASAELIEGWGFMLLAKLQDWTPNNYGKPYDMEKAYEASARAQFLDAIHYKPNNAEYWEALGYASEGKQAIEAYQHALALRPKNPALWYLVFGRRLSDAEQGVPWDERAQAMKKPNGPEAVAALQKAIDQNPVNAYPAYDLAYLKLDPTSYEKNGMNDPGPADQKDQVNAAMERSLTQNDKQVATETLKLMDKAGKATKCFLPIYQPSIPMLLQPAWYLITGVSEPHFLSYAKLRSLARDGYGVAVADAIEHNLPAAIHAERAVIRMGYQLAGSWPVRNSKGGDEVEAPLVGEAIIAIGYEGLLRVERKYGTPAQVKKTQADYDVFKLRNAKYRALVRKNLVTNTYALY